MSQVQVRNIIGQAISLCNFTVSHSENPDDPYIEDFFTDYMGNSSWPHFGVPYQGVWMHVNYYNKQTEYEYKKLFIISGDDVQITLDRNELIRAQINGYYANVFLKGESAFLDLARMCNGQDISPLLEQSLKVGSNGRRIFCMTFNTAKAAGLPPFNPDEHPDYFDMFEALIIQYAKYGLYLYASGFPDNKLFPGWKDNTPKQIDFWNRLGSIAQRHSNVWGLELTNEWDAHDFNGVERAQFTPIPGVICCSGSMGETGSSPMPPPQWDVCDFHQGRQYPNTVVDSCLANHPSRLQGKAVGEGEPLGFGKKSRNPNREENPRIAKEIAGSARGTATHLIFHSESGGFSELYDDVEWPCAEEWFGQLLGA